MLIVIFGIIYRHCLWQRRSDSRFLKHSEHPALPGTGRIRTEGPWSNQLLFARKIIEGKPTAYQFCGSCSIQMCVLTTCVMFPISHESILSVRFGPTWVNSVSDEACDNKCDKCPYKQHIGPRPRPQQRPTVLVSLLRSVVCFHEKNAEKTWKRREKDHPSPEQSWKSLIHYKKPSSHSLELQIWCIYTGWL